jgi:hypothetical protein
MSIDYRLLYPSVMYIQKKKYTITPYDMYDDIVVIEINSEYNIQDLDFDGDEVGEVDMKEPKKHPKRLNKVALRTHRKHEQVSMQLRKQNTNSRYGFHGKDKRNDRRK